MSVTAVAPTIDRPDRRIVSCREYGLIDVVPGDVLGAGGRLEIMPGVLNRYVRADFKDDQLRLRAMGVTGLIPLTDDIMIQVRPRFPLKNLTHMVTVCGYTPIVLSALREYSPSDHWNDWLLDVLADALLISIDTIAQGGMLRTYRRRTEVSGYPHGRIDTTATMLRQAALGVRHRAQYSWFERTVDNSPNRCLKSAAALLHARYLKTPRQSGVRKRISRLAEAMLLLHDVTLESRPYSLEDEVVRGSRPLPETRAYYRQALDVARGILTGQGVSLDAPGGGGLSLPTLLVKTEDLFEDFVRLSLQEAFSDEPGMKVLDGNKVDGRLPLYVEVPRVELRTMPAHTSVFNSEDMPQAQPDIVFRSSGGDHPLVADVKYTNVSAHVDRSELEQIMLYGLRYSCPMVMTIHPKRADSDRGLHISGRIGSVLVAQYRIDLGADDLNAEMLDMNGAIRALIISRSTVREGPLPAPS